MPALSLIFFLKGVCPTLHPFAVCREGGMGVRIHRNFGTLEAKSLLHSDPTDPNILLSGLLDVSSSNSQIMGLGLALSFCLFKIESAHGHLVQTSMLQAVTLKFFCAYHNCI